jgi:hypothetical protein
MSDDQYPPSEYGIEFGETIELEEYGELRVTSNGVGEDTWPVMCVDSEVDDISDIDNEDEIEIFEWMVEHELSVD